MSKRKIFLFAVSLTVACGLAGTAWAHPGRLDKNGGHHKRADGTYHYHRGGDRSIEYSSPVSSSSSSSQKNYTSSTKNTTSKSYSQTTVPVKKADYFVLSAIKTFINGYEMPTFSHSALGGAYIIAEDLKDYGFDTTWNDLTRTLTITKKIGKEFNPLPMAYYKAFGTGYRFFKVNDYNPIQIVFKNAPEESGYKPACFSCDGYMAVSIDELKAFTENWVWSDTDNSLSLTIQ